MFPKAQVVADAFHVCSRQ
ncbi:MAG: hypothetical protein PHI00_01690 [Atribacterota bacterium]|nr:hypothetical protein [Atribacterota bacterium]